jgi:hypothetical protein
VTDLDDFRNGVAALSADLPSSNDPILSKFRSCSELIKLKSALAPLHGRVLSRAKVTTALIRGARLLIESVGRAVPTDFADQIIEIKDILVELRAKAFPVPGFQKQIPSDWWPPSAEVWQALETYLEERGKVEQETRRLTVIFQECLKIPAIADLVEPQDCPLCGTPHSLNADRVAIIRDQITKTQAFQSAEAAAVQSLRQLDSTTRNSADLSDTAMPQFVRWGRVERRQANFTSTRIRSLLGEQAAVLVPPWIRSLRALLRAQKHLSYAAATALTLTRPALADHSKLGNLESLKNAVSNVADAHRAFVNAQRAYASQESALTTRLNSVLDANTQTAGWQDFIDLAADSGDALRKALIENQARSDLQKEIKNALSAIDDAKEKVLDEKFTDLSAKVQTWWDLLRPDESTFFSGLGPRPGARRTIDLKAGLSVNPDRKAPKLRDVIAIFSQSQLHCLGLSLFLARTEHENSGFVLLDDPVLSSDADYRVHFNTSVLERLIELSIQVIVITQDQATWRELENRYRHVGISMFQVAIENPANGAIIRNTSDELLAIISSAQVLARGGHPDNHKQAGKLLRDAGERFCKEMLVENRRASGGTGAALSDYDGKTLDWLCSKVDPLLKMDPSHPGKLRVFKDTVNPPSHDAYYPSSATMKVACGDLRHFVKTYLGR